MPFRPAFRWSPRGRSPRLAEDIHRLRSDPRVHGLFHWFRSHEREIADFQLAVTAIPAPPFGERMRAGWLRERLQPLGLKVTADAVGNLLATRPAWSPQMGDAPATATAPSVAISAHLDTVFPATTALDVRREHAVLYGPGISDNGAGLAALWALAAAFHELGVCTASPLLFIANVGEEGEGDLRGIRHIYREYLREDGSGAVADSTPAPEIAALIALDGAGTSYVVSQALGSRRFEVVISGPGGHSWSDYGVPNPLVAASLAVAALSRVGLPASPRTTLNIGSVEGGTSVNAIPARAVIKIDVRSSDAGQLDRLERRIQEAVAEACAQTEPISQSGRLRYSIKVIGSRPAGELTISSPLLAAVRAVDAQLGIRAETQLASTDANIPISLGLEAISLGAGGSGGGAHTLSEWFDPAGREQALQRLSLLILLLAGLHPSKSDADLLGALPPER